jgi:NADH-quinone oxidoreductase subunit J
MIAAAAFYVFAAILIVSAIMVISARNPVHAVLFLILGFFNASALFLLAGAEFLAMILVIVYVGAVAVLFLFVVMMLDINFSRLREGFQRYAPVGAAVGAVLLIELAGVLGTWKFAPDAASLRMAPVDVSVQNTAQLGNLIYTDYIFLFQAAGLILLVAMIGAIVLTLRDKEHNPKASRHQRVADQVARRKEDTLVMADVPTGGKTLEFFRKLEPVLEDAAPSHGHGHDDHGHAGHGHDDHGHGGH